MNRIWIIFILMGGFVAYAYFGFGGEQVRSNVVPQNGDRKETDIDMGAKNNTAATIKSTTLPINKATTTESKPASKNKP